MKFLLLIIYLGIVSPGPRMPINSAATWAPTTPSNALRLWLKADAISAADNDPVGTWTASSGPNATQATGGSQPAYKTTGLNGHPTVRFDGVDDTLFTADFASAQAQPFTILIAFRVRSTVNNDNKKILDGGPTGLCQFQVFSGSFGLYCNNNDVPFFTADTVYHKARLEVNDSSSKYSFDGAADTTMSSSPGTASLPRIVLAARYDAGLRFCDVDISEVIVYDGILSSGDKTSSYAYLGRWD